MIGLAFAGAQQPEAQNHPSTLQPQAGFHTVGRDKRQMWDAMRDDFDAGRLDSVGARQQ